MKSEDIEAKAVQVLKDCLEEIPFIKIEQVRKRQRQGDIEVDIAVNLRLRDGTVQQVFGAVKPNGQPRLAREAVNRLFRCRSVCPEAYGVFVAPYISPRSADICTKEGVGYLDLAGNCRLAFGQTFIRKEGSRNPFTEKRDLRSVYAPKAARILRVLLMGGRREWRIQPLADEAGVSIGQVANVKKLLRDREWVIENANGFRLTNAEALLAEWSENYTYRKNAIREFYSMKDTDEVESALAKACQELDITYAFTGFSGARQVAPAVRGQRTMAYVSAITEALLDRVELKEVPSGANVILMLPYDAGVYYRAREVDARRVVCAVQLYLDLRGYRGRGEEAAEAVRKQELSELW